MNFLSNYWSQITVILGIIGYIIKTILDYRIRKKEIRIKYFYELKANKIIELHNKIVEIQIYLDRNRHDVEFGTIIYQKRLELDKFYWESKFYFSEKTRTSFEVFLESLKFFENKNMLNQYPDIEKDFETIMKILTREFKNEIL